MIEAAFYTVFELNSTKIRLKMLFWIESGS